MAVSLRHLRQAARPVEALPALLGKLGSKRLEVRTAATGVTEEFAPYVPPPAAGPRLQTIGFDIRSANSIALMGYVGKEVTLRQLAGGSCVASLRLAVHRGRHDRAETDWHNVDAFGELAIAAQQDLGKGSCIQVFGFPKQETYIEKETGVERKAMKVVATSIFHVARSVPLAPQAPPQVQQAQQVQQYSQDYAYQSGADEGFAPQEAAPPPQQPAPQAQASPVKEGTPEDFWTDCVNNPQAWWDNREKKMNPRAPDFKHKETQKPLWLTDRNLPEWVPKALEERDAARSVRM